jgi:predicted secreted hydrolase
MTVPANAAPVARSMPAPFAPFEPRWDAPQLTTAQLAQPHAFEWWYFDLSTEDGVEFVVIFARKSPMWSAAKASMYVEYEDATQKFVKVRNYDRKEFQRTGDDARSEIRVGANSMRIIGQDAASLHYELTIDLPWITGSLTLKPLHRGFLPSSDGAYFTARGDPSRRNCVSFSAPLMSGSGQLTVAGNTRQVSGHGYHDHPWGTELFFWTSREWHWARAMTAEANVMFATVTPFDDFEGALTFCYSGTPGDFEPQLTAALEVTPSKWKKDAMMGIRAPHELKVSVPGRTWTATCTASLLDSPYYKRSAIRWLTDGGPEGHGWVEYWGLGKPYRWLAFAAARLNAFFWRSFPWFGR